MHNTRLRKIFLELPVSRGSYTLRHFFATYNNIPKFAPW